MITNERLFRSTNEGQVFSFDVPPQPLNYTAWRGPAAPVNNIADVLVLGETEGDYQLVEVKGPGDALQDSQKRWLRYFGQQSIPASVAWVQWADD